jgi:hypothetical protein
MARKISKADKILEKVPPIILWSLLFFPFLGGFFFPEFTAYVIILFNVLFLYRSISFFVFFVISFIKLKKSEKVNWQTKLLELDDIESSINVIKSKLEAINNIAISPSISENRYFNSLPIFAKKILFNLEKRKAIKFLQEEIVDLENIKTQGLNYDWKEIHHVILIPHWKEPLNVLRDTLEHLKKVNYPTSKINIVLGAEKRDPEGYDKSILLQNDFKNHFENIWISNHELTEDEIVGKSSNMACAGRLAKQKIDELGWDYKKVIVTSCDADSLLPKDYFSYLTYKYVTIADCYYKYYNAAILFYANIWRLPFYARVKNSISSIFNVSKLIRTDKFVPFSTYSVSFWLVDKIGYWTPWVTPEDYHLYFKGIFFAPDKVSTVPIYQTIMVDAAEGDGHIDTIKNTYYQSRRWSWGVSDDGWMIKQTLLLLINRKLTLRTLYKVSHVIFDHVVGLALTVIILIGGNIPLIVNEAFSTTVLGDNLPKVSEFMVRITLIFMLFMIITDSIFLKPTPETKNRIFHKFKSLFEWIFLPYTGLILVILPGIEAHTRLLFGKYLEYYLTKKK